MGPTWGPSGADRTQVGPMLAPWILLSGTWRFDLTAKVRDHSLYLIGQHVIHFKLHSKLSLISYHLHFISFLAKGILPHFVYKCISLYGLEHNNQLDPLQQISHTLRHDKWVYRVWHHFKWWFFSISIIRLYMLCLCYNFFMEGSAVRRGYYVSA